MMENLYYSPFDLAVIISSMNFGLQKENELINFIWEYEQDFIKPEYRNSKRKFVLNIYYWTNYLKNKADIDLEIPAVKNDMISVGAEIAMAHLYAVVEVFKDTIELFNLAAIIFLSS